MKKLLTLIILALALNMGISQKSVSVQINHFLGGDDFQNEMNSNNDLGNDFMIDRLQYYISQFSLTHDGGQVTQVDDLFVLVSLLESTDPTIIDLGSYDIQNLESVNFYFGINQQANHADPSMWPSSHPLAPQFPSMHWGWAAGYRFIALEGKSGPNIDQELQFHCIGDEFYNEMNFPVSMDEDSEYIVNIDAEYANLLSQIDISSGLILHGGLGEIITLADNLMDKVFTVSSLTNTEDNELVSSFDIYPNPSHDGNFQLDIEVASSDYTVFLNDALGRRVQTIKNFKIKSLSIEKKGLYFLSLIDKKGSVMATRKMIVQ